MTSSDAGVCITFDDNYVYQWHGAKDLFKEYGARATFFVGGFHSLSEHQRWTLRDLERYGHEIGYHTLSHPKASDFLKQFSVQDYIDREIVPGLALMKNYGLEPTAFCYPFSDRNESLDRALLHHFQILRWGSADAKLWFCPPFGNPVVCAGNIDLAVNPERSIEQIRSELHRAKDENSVVVYYAHRIGERGIPYFVLDKICQMVKDIGLQFHTISELAASPTNESLVAAATAAPSNSVIF